MMKHKEFVLADIAKLDSGNKMDKNKMTRKNPSVNFVSRTALNNGISDYVDKIKDIEPFPAGCITLAFGGSVGSCFLQEEPFYTGQNVGVITLPENITTEMKLYFITALEKKCKLYFHAFGNEINKHFKTDLSVSLPVVESDDEKHVYTPNDINWQYMQDRVTELEQEHIAEWEQDRAAKLDAYLKATGLNDYELTEDDKYILASKIKNKDEKEPAKESEPLPEGGWWKEGREFVFSDLFTSQTGDTDIQKKDINGKGYYVVSAGLSNRGIIGKTDRESKVIDKNTITVDMFGNAFYRDTEYKMVTHARVFALSPKFEMTEKIGLYMTSCMSYLAKKFAYSNMCSWNKIQDLPLCLPIQTDDSGKPVIDASKTYSPKGYIPDWEYMEKRIKAAEKEIIKEVVLYKDKVIAKAKEITGEKEVA